MIRPAPRRLELLLVAAAVALRVAVLPLAPRWGYLPDHADLARWGLQAVDHGPLSLYRRPPDAWPVVAYVGDTPRRAVRSHHRPYNYGPLTAYGLWASGCAFAALSPDRLLNTVRSRAAFAPWGLLGDLLLAWGGARLVAALRPSAAARAAFGLLLFAPAAAWTSAVWGQVDSPVLAAAVWMLWAMVEGRWLLAGALFGAAAALKPQVVFFLALWGFAAVTRPKRALPALGLAAVALFLAALPFTLDSGLAWFRASFVNSVSDYREYTTLMAFNLWYADALASGSRNAAVVRLGLSKAQWGDLLLVAGLALSLVASLRRWGRSGPDAEGGGRAYAAGLLLWTVVSLLLSVMLPTRVHERYLLVPLPFLVAAAAVWRPLLVPALLLNVVALAQVTWPLWWRGGSGTRPLEWALTGLALVTAAAAVGRAFKLPPPGKAEAPR